MVLTCKSIKPLTFGASEVTIVYELNNPISKNLRKELLLVKF